MKRIVTAATLALAYFALATASAQAAPTLNGEELSAIGPVIPNACPTAGTTASGVASGPYPGTFTETFEFTYEHDFGGFGTFGPPGHMTASFTIVSDSTTVTGTKTSTDLEGICGGGSGGTVFFAHAVGPYEATISTPQGAFSDHGAAVTDLDVSFNAEGTVTYTFNEVFASVPTSKGDCKNDGWRNFPQFTNEGECVRFVQTGKL
jgi:hypothetical protein